MLWINILKNNSAPIYIMHTNKINFISGPFWVMNISLLLDRHHICLVISNIIKNAAKNIAKLYHKVFVTYGRTDRRTDGP